MKKILVFSAITSIYLFGANYTNNVNMDFVKKFNKTNGYKTEKYNVNDLKNKEKKMLSDREKSLNNDGKLNFEVPKGALKYENDDVNMDQNYNTKEMNKLMDKVKNKTKDLNQNEFRQLKKLQKINKQLDNSGFGQANTKGW